MAQKITVSVIIPVYNAETHLRECLDSVLEQTVKDLEIICVDDGSRDSSLRILHEYARKDERIIVAVQQNRYAGVARNHGMSLARGTYLAFLDADDLYEPDALEIMLEKARSCELDFVKGSFLNIQEGGAPFDSYYSANRGVSPDSFEKPLSFSENMEDLLWIADVPWNGVYRTSFLKTNNIQFNDFRCVNDHSFHIECVIHARRGMVISRCVVRHRVSQSSSLVGKKGDHFDCQIRNYALIRKIIAHLPEAQRRVFLQRELTDLLDWYRLLATEDTADSHAELDRQMFSFISAFDEKDVGVRFLLTMPDSELYYSLKAHRPVSTDAAGGDDGKTVVRRASSVSGHGLSFLLQRKIRALLRLVISRLNP